MYDYLVVGAGFFGATFAWHTVQANKRVLVIDRRGHVGGNCYTYRQEGINVHAYGPHIFHTSNLEIWNFVNRFAKFNRYVHRVKARNGDKIFSLPFNLQTMNQVWGVNTPEEARQRLELERVKNDDPRNMEEWALSQVGREMYGLLVSGYTQKQWGKDPSQLPASILRRLPVRFSWDDDYYNDTYQGIPIGGYTQIFERLLEGCDVKLNVDYLAERDVLRRLAKCVIYTGPIDAYFSHSLGELEYRTLSFETKVLDVPDFQGCAQLNWTGLEVPWTRTVEHRHFDQPKEQINKTIVTWETPAAWKCGSEPYYPVNDVRNNELFRRYNELVEHEMGVLFGGRLGSFRYMDMHQVIAQATTLAKKEGLCG